MNRPDEELPGYDEWNRSIKWRDSKDMTDREAELIGETIASWLYREQLNRDATAFANRIKATILLKEILGPSSQMIPNPKSGG